MITEYDRFSEEDSAFKSKGPSDPVKPQQPAAALAEETPEALSMADPLAAQATALEADQMGTQKKALHQITVGEKGEGADTDLAANVGFEDQLGVGEGSDLEANNSVDP